MELIVRKWGNSAVVRIPAVMRAAHLSVDQAVDMRAEDGRIIVEPLREAWIVPRGYPQLVELIDRDGASRR